MLGGACFAVRLIVPHLIKLRLFLTLVTASSFSWEGGYFIQAMRTKTENCISSCAGGSEP